MPGGGERLNGSLTLRGGLASVRSLTFSTRDLLCYRCIPSLIRNPDCLQPPNQIYVQVRQVGCLGAISVSTPLG